MICTVRHFTNFPFFGLWFFFFFLQVKSSDCICLSWSETTAQNTKREKRRGRCLFSLPNGTTSIPVHVSVISHQSWKWPVKSKLVLQEVSSMPLLIRALLPLGPQPHFSFSTPSSVSPTLSGDTACVSSVEQRKPKTRGILLKGVIQQPDINNLHVCRAQSKPLGICGFTWLCVFLTLSVFLHACICAEIFPWIMSPICAIKHFNVWHDSITANCYNIGPKIQWCDSSALYTFQ